MVKCGIIYDFFVAKNKGQTQKASGPKVADWEYVGVDKFTRIETARVEIGRILRTDFCAQDCYSSIDKQGMHSTRVLYTLLLGLCLGWKGQ